VRSEPVLPAAAGLILAATLVVALAVAAARDHARRRRLVNAGVDDAKRSVVLGKLRLLPIDQESVTSFDDAPVVEFTDQKGCRWRISVELVEPLTGRRRRDERIVARSWEPLEESLSAFAAAHDAGFPVYPCGLIASIATRTDDN